MNRMMQEDTCTPRGSMRRNNMMHNGNMNNAAMMCNGNTQNAAMMHNGNMMNNGNMMHNGNMMNNGNGDMHMYMQDQLGNSVNVNVRDMEMVRQIGNMTPRKSLVIFSLSLN